MEKERKNEEEEKNRISLPSHWKFSCMRVAEFGQLARMTRTQMPKIEFCRFVPAADLR